MKQQIKSKHEQPINPQKKTSPDEKVSWNQQLTTNQKRDSIN
jgi:hypothetical protein